MTGRSGEVSDDRDDLFVETLALPFDVVETLADLGDGSGAVGGKVEQVGLLGVEAGELLGHLLLA
ncbi:MAG: hypothetical protein QM733_20680 [Ilumatobacteraceae bacterium]